MILRRVLRTNRRVRQSRARSLCVEVLERRRLLAADIFTNDLSSRVDVPSSLAVDGIAEGEFVAGPWTNPINRFDVDGDGTVNVQDALRTIGARGEPSIVGQTCADASNAGQVSFCVLPLSKPDGLPFVDVSGDGLITDDDGQQIASFLSGNSPAIFVSPQPNRARLTTTEAGGTALFTISLIPAPTAEVTISIASNNTAEGTVSTNLLTFTPTSDIQQVTVTGVADGVTDGDQIYLIQIGDAVSTDPNYNGLVIDDLPVTNIDGSATSLLDFGDLPNSFSTTLASNGARHTTGSLFLGGSVDSEADASPSAAADGDGNDEDGVSQITSLIASTIVATTGSFLVSSSLAAKLDAWIDFNGNGSFENPAEHIGMGTSIDLSAGPNIVPLQIPAGSSSGQAAARFRVSSAGGLSPTGAATDGEVEDYFFSLLDAAANPEVVLTPPSGSGQLTTDGNDIVAITELIEVFRAPGNSIASISANGNSSDNTLEIANLDAVFSGLVRADGGIGFDRLVFTGGGQSIDLTLLTPGDLAGIESIDLSGSGDNTLKLNVDVVEALSDTTDTLKLIYDAGDTVDFLNDWVVQRPEIIDGTYQHVVTGASSSARIEITNSFPHQNPVDPLDTNRKDGAKVIDPLLVINAIARGQGGPLATPTTAAEIPSFYLDVRADNQLTTIDAFRVINFLALGGSGSGQPEQQLVLMVNSATNADVTVDRDAREKDLPDINYVSRQELTMPLTELVNMRFEPISAPLVAESDQAETLAEIDRQLTLLSDAV